MELNVLQNKMIDLLSELDTLLRNNDIKYMLYCGSQLGSDRHHGIIPWDDDVDIMMSLDNYDKFIELAKKGLPVGRKVDALELSTDYPLCYARYVDTTTTALQRHTIFGGVAPGVKVDVFFCVPTSSNKKKALQHQMEILAFNEVLLDNAVMVYKRPDDFFPAYEKEKALYTRLGKEAYIRKRLPELKYRYVSRFRKPSKYIFFSGMIGNSHFFDAEEITHTVDVDFSGIRVAAAANGPYYNIESYDESWYQVPENVTKPHHIWATDLDTPFSEYLNKVGDYFDLDDILQAERTRKTVHLEEQLLYTDAIITGVKLKNLAVSMSVEKAYRECLPEASLSDKYELFSPYYKRQLSKENRWYKLAIPVSPDVFSEALRCLAAMGEFARAMNIIEITGDISIPGISEIRKQLELSRRLVYAIYVYPDTLGAEEGYVAELQNKGTVNLTLYEASGRLLLESMRKAGNPDERIIISEKILDTVSDGIQIFGNRTELLILKAFAIKELEKHGKLKDETSTDIFENVLRNTLNGFIVQEVLDQGFDLPDPEEPEYSEDDYLKPSDMIFHYYLPEEAFEKMREHLASLAEGDPIYKLESRGKGSKRTLTLYNKTALASTVTATAQKDLKKMSYKTVWHIADDGNTRTEVKTAPISACNIPPDVFLSEAERSGILGDNEAARYLEYRAWKKERSGDSEKVFRQFTEDFRSFAQSMQNREQ